MRTQRSVQFLQGGGRERLPAEQVKETGIAFKDLLLGLFFVTVGMQIDLALLLANPALILLGVFGLFAIKIAIIAPLARLFAIPWPRALAIAFLLGQRQFIESIALSGVKE